MKPIRMISFFSLATAVVISLASVQLFHQPLMAQASPSAADTNWGSFRGANQGFASPALPYRFQADNVAWKTELPGRGASTPICIGNKIITTCYSGFGEQPEAPGTVDQLRHHVLCHDATTGKLLWQRDVAGNSATPPRVSANLGGHGFASSTAASDGETIVCFFGISGLFAFDVDGQFLWQNDVGWRSDNFGSSSSLTIEENLVIVNASIESETVYAFDLKSGRGIWKIDDVFRSWSTPVVGENQKGARELVLVQKDIVRGFDPLTGVELWSCEGIHDYIVPTPVISDGVAFLNGGKESRTVAIKLGGTGDVTETHRLWEARYGANVGSPIVYNGLVFNVLENGIVNCFRATDGKLVKRERVRGAGVVHGSPTLVLPATKDGTAHLLVPLKKTGVGVLQANESVKFVGYNVYEKDPADFKASFSVANNCFITRNDEYLFCISKQKQADAQVHQYAPPEARELIASTDKFDFDSNSKRIKVYNRCLDFEAERLVDFILIPYKSVLTSKQSIKFREEVLATTEPFLKLRQRRQQIIWQYLSQSPSNRDANNYQMLMARLEKDAMATQRDLRAIIKGQFTPEQLQAHLAEANGGSSKK